MSSDANNTFKIVYTPHIANSDASRPGIPI
jgi:hypothetical protein